MVIFRGQMYPMGDVRGGGKSLTFARLDALRLGGTRCRDPPPRPAIRSCPRPAVVADGYLASLSAARARDEPGGVGFLSRRRRRRASRVVSRRHESVPVRRRPRDIFLSRTSAPEHLPPRGRISRTIMRQACVNLPSCSLIHPVPRKLPPRTSAPWM